VDNLLILTSGTEQYLITCKNKKYIFLLTTTLTISALGKYILNVLYNFNTSISTKCGKNLSTVYETGKNVAYFSLK